MLSEQRLIDIGSYLELSRMSGDREIADLKDVLESIYVLDSYQEWLTTGHFHNRMSPDNRYSLPHWFGIGSDAGRMHLLDKFALINGGQLTVKVDKHSGRIFLTDGNWVPANRRVFPYADESEALIRFAHSKSLFDEVDTLIDPACGCGHHALGTQNGLVKISSDISPRAIAYSKINSILCGEKDILLFTRDICDGIHPVINNICSKKCIILINMPFTTVPRPGHLVMAAFSDGGDKGIGLSIKALGAIKNFIDKAAAEDVSALLLCYSLGNANHNTWEIEKISHKIFGAGAVTFNLLLEERLWRVNGKKEQVNPMPVKGRLSLKGRCSHTFEKGDMEEQVEGYQRLEDKFEREGLTHLAYGVVHVQKQKAT